MVTKYDLTALGFVANLYCERYNLTTNELANSIGVKNYSLQLAKRSERGFENLRKKTMAWLRERDPLFVEDSLHLYEQYFKGV
ncbi:MAG: hypothetical protein LBN00_06540 [Oscillospiraceae bacterium]|nr:hypothetical protein [Oscillospiraceae bacterium]